MSARRIVRGQTLSFPSPIAVDHEMRGAVVIGRDGRILWMGPYRRLPRRYRGAPVDDYGDCLVMPGFIDAHIHFPQYRMLAAPGLDLLDWLARFTFPEEARYADRAHADRAAADLSRSPVRQRHHLGARLLLGPQDLRRGAVRRRRRHATWRLRPARP